jgi:hypothetical protein
MSDRGTPPAEQQAPIIEMEMAAPPADVDPESDADPDEPAAPSRTRTAALAGLLVLGLAGAAVLGTFGWGVAREKDATLTPPNEVAGLTRDTSENATAAAEDLRTTLSAKIDLDSSIGVIYADPASPTRSVLVFGGTTLIWTPESDLDTTFGLFSDKTGEVTGITEVDAGSLGGVMKCGMTASPEGDIAVCGWADHGSLTMALFPNRPATESATVLRQIREATQKRS